MSKTCCEIILNFSKCFMYSKCSRNCGTTVGEGKELPAPLCMQIQAECGHTHEGGGIVCTAQNVRLRPHGVNGCARKIHLHVKTHMHVSFWPECR